MKMLMVSTVASMISLFNMDNIRVLQELGFTVEVACNFEEGNVVSDEAIANFSKHLESIGVIQHHISFPRNPFDFPKLYQSFVMIQSLINSNHFSFVHCHSPIASALVRLAAHRRRHIPVVYSAHGFQFQKKGPILPWLLYYPIEKFLSKMTDVLIVLNEEDYQVAKRRFHANEIVLLKGVGISVQRFHLPCFDQAKHKKELGISADTKMILSVGELNRNKNHEVVIRALARFENKNIHYFIAGKGYLEKELRKLAENLGVGNKVHLLGYRADIPELLNTADLFAFPSYREGLAVSIMEALAAGLPIVTSNVRGVIDFHRWAEVGLSCDAGNAEQFANAIQQILENPNLYQKYSSNAKILSSQFDINCITSEMRSIYQRYT